MKNETRMTEARFKANFVEITILPERLEMYTVHAFKNEVLGHLEGRPSVAVLNLAKVEFIDSSAIGVLFFLKKFIENYGGRLALSHLAPSVHLVLKATRMLSMLQVFATTQDAIRTLS
jgi:anti-sigma B factor antagonist